VLPILTVTPLPDSIDGDHPLFRHRFRVVGLLPAAVLRSKAEAEFMGRKKVLNMKGVEMSRKNVSEDAKPRALDSRGESGGHYEHERSAIGYVRWIYYSTEHHNEMAALI
jgi:hypothetical protein